MQCRPCARVVAPPTGIAPTSLLLLPATCCCRPQWISRPSTTAWCSSPASTWRTACCPAWETGTASPSGCLRAAGCRRQTAVAAARSARRCAARWPARSRWVSWGLREEGSRAGPALQGWRSGEWCQQRPHHALTHPPALWLPTLPHPPPLAWRRHGGGVAPATAPPAAQARRQVRLPSGVGAQPAGEPPRGSRAAAGAPNLLARGGRHRARFCAHTGCSRSWAASRHAAPGLVLIECGFLVRL